MNKIQMVIAESAVSNLEGVVNTLREVERQLRNAKHIKLNEVADVVAYEIDHISDTAKKTKALVDTKVSI